MLHFARVSNFTIYRYVIFNKANSVLVDVFDHQVLAGVTRDMKIAQEEVFGPVMTIIKVPGDSDERCIEMVNDCK